MGLMIESSRLAVRHVLGRLILVESLLKVGCRKKTTRMTNPAACIDLIPPLRRPMCIERNMVMYKKAIGIARQES